MERECTEADIFKSISPEKMNDFGFYETCISQQSAEYYLGLDPRITPGLPIHFFALCAKISNCSEESVRRLFDRLFDQFEQENGYLRDESNPIQIYRHSDGHQDPFRFFSSISFYYLLAVILIALLAILSTTMIKGLKARIVEEEGEVGLNNDETAQKRREKQLKKSFWSHFDMVANTKKITSPPKFKDPISQTFTIGRPIAMFLVMMVHEMTIKQRLLTDPKNWQIEQKTHPGMAFVFMCCYAVSLFFFMGGYVSIIACDAFYKKAKKINRNFILTYFYLSVRRYMRFAPVMVMVELYMMVVVPEFGGSPYTLIYNQTRSLFCHPSLFFHQMLGLHHCSEWIWYLFCDFTLYLVMVFVVMLAKTPIQRNLLMVALVVFSFICSSYQLLS